MDNERQANHEALARSVLRAQHGNPRPTDTELALATAVAELSAELRRMAAAAPPAEPPPRLVPATVEDLLVEAARVAQTTEDLLAVASFRRGMVA